MSSPPSRRGGSATNATTESIFSQTLPVRVKPHDREEFGAHLTIKLEFSQSVSENRSATGGAPALVFELTDQTDPFFLYTLRVSEQDFHCLKTDQRLLVDYQAFPSMVQKLIGECVSGSNMTANLLVDDTESATLSIVEANQFRELTHFALRLRRGNDSAVKQYLAGRLGHFRTLSTTLDEKLRQTEEELKRTIHVKEATTTQLQAAQQEVEQALRTEKAAHAKEVADIREEYTREIRTLVESSSTERTVESRGLRDAVRTAELKAAASDRQSEELRSTISAIEIELNAVKRRLSQTETEASASNRSLDEARNDLRESETTKFKLEKRVAELSVEVTGLRENLQSKEKLATNSSTMIDQINEQKRSLEETINSLKTQIAASDKRLTESNDQLNKAARAVEALETLAKNQKAKMKLKVGALHQQETLIQELEKNKHDLVRENSSLKETIEREKESTARAKHDLEATNVKLTDAHNLLHSNEQVITYLNKQLTDREVRTFSTTPNALQIGSKLKTRPMVTALTPAMSSVGSSPTLKAIPDFPLRSAAPSLAVEIDNLNLSSRVAPVSFAPRSARSNYE